MSQWILFSPARRNCYDSGGWGRRWTFLNCDGKLPLAILPLNPFSEFRISMGSTWKWTGRSKELFGIDQQRLKQKAPNLRDCFACVGARNTTLKLR